MSALRELLAVFGVEFDDEGIKKGEHAVEGFKEKLGKAAEVFAEALAIDQVKEFVQGTVEAGARVGDLSERLGLSAHELQAFQFAASLAGVDAEGAAHSLSLFNRTIGEAAGGGGEAAQTFAKLGISVRDSQGHVRDTTAVLGDVAEAFVGMGSQQERAAEAMKLFGRDGAAMLPVLADGREGIAGLRAEFEELGGGMSDAFVKQAKKVDDEEQKLALGFRSIKTAIVAEMLPGLLRVVDWFKQGVVWFQRFTRETNAVKTALMFFGGGAIIGGLRSLSTALGGVIAEELLLAAPVVLAYLAFDDLFTFVNGGQSVIGSLVDRFLGIGKGAEYAEDLGDALRFVKDIAGPLGTLIEQSIVAPFKMAADVARGLADSIGGLVHADFGRVAHAFDRVSADAQEEANAGADFAGAANASGERLVRRRDTRANAEAMDRRYGATASPAGNFVELNSAVPVPYVFGPHGGVPAPAAPPASPMINQTINVETHVTSSDPEAIASAVGQGVSTGVQRANAHARTTTRKP